MEMMQQDRAEMGANLQAEATKFRVKLLGRFAVTTGEGKACTPTGKKNQALLSCLAANAGRPQARERLAALLWGDRFDDQARQSLRQAISMLRRDLDPDGKVLLSEGDEIVLDAAAVSVDTLHLEDLAAEGSESALDEAALLYRGAFLDGFSIRERAFEEWAASQRARYAEIAADVLDKLRTLHERAGRVDQAIAAAQRLIGIDSLHEKAHRDLMRLLATSGQRSQALKQYRLCSETLQRELGVEPEAETIRLYEDIKGSETFLPATPRETAVREVQIESRPPMPEGPSIAVLPFVNLSGDSEQEYFSDGITDDLITALSNVRTFLVIARQSTFAYKGRACDVKEIGRELGVRYVLEGSVRKAGNRVRVTAQLVEAESGTHIWADRYDGSLDDIFDLQDKIAESVVGAIEPQLHRAEFERVKQKRPESFDAYDLTLYGLAKMNRLTAQDNDEALQCFLNAIEIDPGYARAYVCASYCHRRQVQLKGLMLPENAFADAIRLAREGLRLDPTDPYVLWQTALTFALVGKDFDEALMLVKRSLSINSSSNRAWIASGMVHCYVGKPETAIDHAERAMRLSPLDVSMWVACWVMATAHLQLGEYEEAADWARKSLRRHPENLSAKYVLASSLVHTGRQDDAEAVIAELLEMHPDMTVSRFREIHPVARYRNLQAFLDGLRKAGLPE